MTPIQNQDELAAAIDRPRALLLLWVNWSIHARNARTLVEAASAAWEVQHPDQSTPCYVVDVSNQAGALWDALADWLTAQGRPAGNLMAAGAGSLLWVRSGRVALHTVSPLSLGQATVEALTRSVFASAAV